MGIAFVGGLIYGAIKKHYEGGSASESLSAGITTGAEAGFAVGIAAEIAAAAPLIQLAARIYGYRAAAALGIGAVGSEISPVVQQEVSGECSALANERRISVYHGSINHSTAIRANGLDPMKGSAYVSRDIAVARDAIGPNRLEINQGLAKDPGIVESSIPESQFGILAPPGAEREYPGFYGSNLDSTEILLLEIEQFQVFNENIVR